MTNIFSPPAIQEVALERHVPLEELAVAAGVHPRTVRREIDEGRLEARKIRGALRVPISSAKQWLANLPKAGKGIPSAT